MFILIVNTRHYKIKEILSKRIVGPENGDKGALSEIIECISLLVDFYPKHIEKEDKHFFIPVMEYFSEYEKDALLNEGYEFDSKLMHQEYAEGVSKLEKESEEKFPLPFCRTAADPEHARAYEEDEPCDDARSGQIK